MIFIGAALAVAAAVLAAVGCGGSSSEGGDTTATKALKVGLVTDIGGLNDRSFNHLAYVGLQRAEKQLGVDGRVLISNSSADYVPNLSTLARQHYDLVIGVGFLMAGPVESVAKGFPSVRFAIIDSSQAAMKSKPKNVRGLLFREQQAGYLAGYLAGLVEKAGGPKVDPATNLLSSVGGQKIPPVDHYIAGFQAGATAAYPGIKTVNAYSQSFTDQSKCKELALSQIAQGSDVVFQVAGGCGLGALDAAKGQGVWGIGVDADQSYLGAHILTSAVKKVDVAVFDTVKAIQDDRFAAGDVYFDLTNNGVGIGKISPQVPASIRDAVDKRRQEIAAGTVTGIPTEVH